MAASVACFIPTCITQISHHATGNRHCQPDLLLSRAHAMVRAYTLCPGRCSPFFTKDLMRSFQERPRCSTWVQPQTPQPEATLAPRLSPPALMQSLALLPVQAFKSHTCPSPHTQLCRVQWIHLWNRKRNHSRSWPVSPSSHPSLPLY